jgi:imidazolonepropionase-like amidohydrolase
MASIEIRNCTVFDGKQMTGMEKVVIENGVISGEDSGKAGGEVVVDGEGGTLLPGFIDSHVHLYEHKNLEELCRYGVTTAFDMANRSSDFVNSIRNASGLTDIRSCCFPAFAEGSVLATKMHFPTSANVKNVADSERFVTEQIAAGADYIKIILEDKGINDGVAFPQEVLVSLIENAHKNNKKTIAHAASPKTYQAATKAGIDIVTHVPFTATLSRALVKKIAAQNIVSVPTIYTMKGIVEMIQKKVPLIPFSYKKIQKNMARMHKYGIPFLAGTDANMHDPTSPFSAPYGISFLEELVLMADCGLSPVEVLQSATSIPAEYWGLKDRGCIKAGNRADLVLVDGNPVTDIHAVKNIKQVWVAGKLV